MQTRRSTLVSVLGWVLIIFHSLGLLVTLIQQAVIQVFLDAGIQPVGGEEIPGILHAFLQNLPMVIWALSFMMLGGLAVSISFLRRQNWARIAVIVMLGMGIAYYAAGLGFQWLIWDQFTGQAMHFVANVPEMQFFFKNGFMISALISIAFSALYGALIKFLLTPDIVREFNTAS
ncbi:MAG: hypothetical protein AAFV07_00835 [Bacteroidota bacterium]